MGTAILPLIEKEMQTATPHGESWLVRYEEKESIRRGYRFITDYDDPRALLRILRFERAVFSEIDGTQRAWIDEIIQASNRAAHSTTITTQRTNRALETMSLLASSLGLEDTASEIDELQNHEALDKTTAENMPQTGSEEFNTFNEKDIVVQARHSRMESNTIAQEFEPLLSHGLLPLSVSTAELDIIVFYREAINYALVHNAISPIGAVFIRNKTDSEINDLHLVIHMKNPLNDLNLGIPLEIKIARIAAREVIDIPPGQLQWRIPAQSFIEIDESITSEIELSVATLGDRFYDQNSIRLLPMDEWWARSIPEQLAAFVRPNEQSVQNLVLEASALLEQRTGSSSLEGYQSGPGRVYLIAEAIYDVMSNKHIRYLEPPPSFEGTGQRIRRHSQVLDERVGTCIDLACLYAAALEFAGLNPILCWVNGHMFVGYLTEDQQLSNTAIGDQAAIRTIVDSDLFDSVEITSVTDSESRISFDEARGKTRKWWGAEIHQVKYLLDIDGAHRRVRPLPNVHTENGMTFIETVNEITAPPTRHLPYQSQASDLTNSSEHLPGRVSRWKRSLLDMSYMNPLLKLKKSAAVPIHVPAGTLADFENSLAGRSTFTLLPDDKIAAIHKAQGARTAADVEASSLTKILLEEKIGYVALSGSEYDRTLKNLTRRAKSAFEETGVDNLYIAFGTLEWREREKTGCAPLFLVPVTVQSFRGDRPYEIVLDDSRDIQPNYCLIEKLRMSWNLKLDVLENPINDENGVDIDGVLASIRSQILRENLESFHVEETAHLALLQFSTLEMWRDLTDNWEEFMSRPVVKHLVETPGQPYIDDIDLPPIDPLLEANVNLPIPADGSQIQAVQWASAGKSFILEGPPGTGKSQTITNLIAHLLSEGKKVLFVAEKQAALDVVKRRLTSVGLGTFSLDIHGRTQSVAEVRRQISEAIEAR